MDLIINLVIFSSHVYLFKYVVVFDPVLRLNFRSFVRKILSNLCMCVCVMDL